MSTYSSSIILAVRTIVGILKSKMYFYRYLVNVNASAFQMVSNTYENNI